MNLQISENKYIDINNTSGIKYTLCIAKDSPFGSNYYVVKIFKDYKLYNLLKEYENNKIEFIIFNEILYIFFNKDNYCFYADFPEYYIKQIKDKNQIVFTIKENNIEYFLSYDKIFT